jgi:glucose/arabinose dehydrogenase
MRHRQGAILALVLAGAMWAATPAAGQPPIGNGQGGVDLTEIADVGDPAYLAQPPGDSTRLFVVRKPGVIRLLKNGVLQPTPFLDIQDLVSENGERGLLSMAFPPDYSSSGLFYVYFTNNSGDIRVTEYERSGNPDLADESTKRAVMKISHPNFGNHNGGQLQFGPDGYLYAGTGDGGSAGDPPNNAQNKNSFLGKLLRIDPAPSKSKNHTVPTDNPFAGSIPGRGEIWSLGLRNPWRFSFDRSTGALSLGDVGQARYEEIDYREQPNALRGKNLGWSGYEGFAVFNRSRRPGSWTRPIHAYSHGNGNCSITGGYVVRDEDLTTLYGRYIYADFCKGKLRSLVPHESGGTDDKWLGQNYVVSNPSSFAEDNAGNLYVMSLGTGRVFRLDPAP